MTNADWWARVVQARTERDDLRPKRVWALRKDGREAAIDVQGGARHRRGDRAHGGRGVAQDAAVPLARAGGTGRRDCGHADDVRGEGVGVTRSRPGRLRARSLSRVNSGEPLRSVGEVPTKALPLMGAQPPSLRRREESLD